MADFRLPMCCHWTHVGERCLQSALEGWCKLTPARHWNFWEVQMTGIGRWNDLSPHKEKNIQVCKQNSSSIPPHSLNPKASSSNVQGTQRESKSWKVTCTSDDSRQESWEVDSTLPILMLWATKHSFRSSSGIQFPRWCMSSDVHICQCQWRCLHSVWAALHRSHKQAGKHEKPNSSQFSFIEKSSKAGVSNSSGKVLSLRVLFANHWLANGEKAMVYKQRWLMTSEGLEQFLYMVLTANKWK